MKLAGMAGTGSGKLGSHVYASLRGQQIVRNLQAQVSNPNSVAQVEQRGRLKLMSQISAAMASVIVMPRNGARSARNMFSKRNFKFVAAGRDNAVAFLEQIKLTNGLAAIPRVDASRDIADKIELCLYSSAVGQVDRVIYNVFARTEEGYLLLVRSAVVEEAGELGIFPCIVDDYNADLYIYAYGMKDLNARARAKYGSYQVQSGEDIAKLIMTRTLLPSDYQFTDTTGTSIAIDQEEPELIDENEVKITIAFAGDGAVRNNTQTGTVVKSPLIKLRGSHLKWWAVPAPGHFFEGWTIVSDGGKKVTSNPLEFTVWADAQILVNCPAIVSNADTIGGLE